MRRPWQAFFPVLLIAMAPRSASAHGELVSGWHALMRSGFRYLKKLCLLRQASNSPDTLSGAALKDIGLSLSDLPSVSTGRFFSDPTRKQR